MECILRREDGETVRWSLRLDELPDAEIVTWDGVSYVEKRLPLPGPLPIGYHQLAIESGNWQWDTLLIAAPTRAYSPHGNGWERAWGVFLPLYAVQSEGNWGAGDFADLRALRREAHRMGAGLVGTLPLLAAFLDEPLMEISPYSPVSRLFWNEFYLNIEEIPELRRSPTAERLVQAARSSSGNGAPNASPLVDYRGVMARKREVLQELSRTVFNLESDRRSQLEAFVAKNAAVEDYAKFRAICERLGKPWSEWPERLRRGEVTSADYDEAAKRYHIYVQWLADQQLEIGSEEQATAGLYLDLPLGVHANGYDVWRYREDFAVGVAGGCPPDSVFPKGQNWGFVPLHPEGIRTQRYRYVQQYVRHQMRRAKVLRIDHMPSFHRLFWIPPDTDPNEGVYVRYRAEELYAVFCLESHRHQTMLVGEDLGTVPPEVAQGMLRHHFHRMFVVQYELQPDSGLAIPEPPASCIASLNTHDMPPFAGFWEGKDIRERYHCGLISAEQQAEQFQTRRRLCHALLEFLQSARGLSEQASVQDLFRACLDHLCDSPARLVLINLEDLWQETESQNMPSTCDENPNWRRRARYSIQQVFGRSDFVEILSRLGRTIR
jgi:4-alpha-glucanotransferase